MKKLFFGGVALVALFASPAMAADMPARAPVVYKAPVVLAFNWSGFYLGANAGYGWEDDPSYTTNLTNCNVAGVCDAGLIFGIPANLALGSALGTGPGGRGNGFVGGFQAGYNFQFSNVVLGVEADWDTFKRSHGLTSSGIATTGDILTVSNQSSSNWIATARARAGLVWDRTLVYITGGAAWTRFAYSETMFTTLGASSGAFSASQTKTGWTVGGGAEFAFAGNWSVKAEYLYAQFSGVAGTGALNSTAPAGFSNVYNGSTETYRDNTVRLGLNYRFGSAPVMDNR